MFELLDAHTLVVAIDRNKAGLVSTEGLQRCEIAGILYYYGIAGFYKDFPNKIDALLRSGCDQHSITGRIYAMLPPSTRDPLGKRSPALRGAVLKGGRAFISEDVGVCLRDRCYRKQLR